MPDAVARRPRRRIDVTPGDHLDTTESIVILDRSGSMQDSKADHEGGLRQYVDDQKELEGNVAFTLIQFNTENPCEIVYDGASLNQVTGITLQPGGGTPLFAAICRGLEHVKARLAARERQPDLVDIMIITDGRPEGTQFGYTKEQAAAAIKECEDRGWQVRYLGANVDAFAEAHSVGVSSLRAANFTMAPSNVRAMYDASSHNMLRARSLQQHGADRGAVLASYSYTDEQRTAMTAAPDINRPSFNAPTPPPANP